MHLYPRPRPPRGCGPYPRPVRPARALAYSAPADDFYLGALFDVDVLATG